jgi:hypothetical protein
MADSKKGSIISRFRVGNKVRVKYGVIVPDFPDIPLGGWTGTVTEVEQADDQITYEIKWNKRTLNGMHPVYRKRCERDGFEMETMWLGEEDQDDRVRMARGLTHDDPLPDVSRKTLLAYCRYLAANPKFPF